VPLKRPQEEESTTGAKKAADKMRTHHVPVSPRTRSQDVMPARTARTFWQRFIDRVSFDLPGQPAPMHGGRNWVKIPMPSDGQWITGYGYQDRLGLYLSFDWKKDPGLYDVLFRETDALQRRSGVDITFDRGKRFIGIRRSREQIGDEDAQIEWLCATANGLVRAFRPRLEELAR
jgi:hypothetical protein